MGVKKFKPTSPGRRNMSASDFAEVTASKPHKRLTSSLSRKAGRNVYGRITPGCLAAAASVPRSPTQQLMHVVSPASPNAQDHNPSLL